MFTGGTESNQCMKLGFFEVFTVFLELLQSYEKNLTRSFFCSMETGHDWLRDALAYFWVFLRFFSHRNTISCTSQLKLKFLFYDRFLQCV